MSASEPQGGDAPGPDSAGRMHERLIEIALSELLREGDAPDYAASVWDRWQEQSESAAPIRTGRRFEAGVRRRDTTVSGDARRAAPRWLLPALGLAAAGLVAAGWWWRDAPSTGAGGAQEHDAHVAEVDARGPEPAPSRLRRDPGLEVLPADDAEILWNPSPNVLAVELEGGGRVALASGAIVAFGHAPRAASGFDTTIEPRLLDGEARFEFQGEGEHRVWLGNSPAPLSLAQGGSFRAELARASGPSPLADSPLRAAPVEGSSEAPSTEPRGYGRGLLLGPTWLTIDPLVGELMWGTVAGDRVRVRGRFQGEVLDTRGSTRPFDRGLQDELDSLLNTVAHVPGATPWPKEPPSNWMAFAETESALLGWLAKSPALWVPVDRELTQRLGAHGEAEWWRLGLSIYAHSRTAAAELAAQRLWRRMPERFDTDALLAFAARDIEPFVTELLALDARLPELLSARGTEATRSVAPPSGPAGDLDLLALAALARGDERYVGRALDLAAPLVGWRLQNVIDPATQRAILAAATLAWHGLDAPWEDFVSRLLPRVEESIEGGAYTGIAQVAATLDAAAMVFGLPPFDADDPREVEAEGPRLAYFLRLAGRETGRFFEAGAAESALTTWLRTWRER